MQDIGAPVNGLLDAKAANDVDHAAYNAHFAALDTLVTGLQKGSSTTAINGSSASGPTSVIFNAPGQPVVLTLSQGRDVEITLINFIPTGTGGIGTINNTGGGGTVGWNIRRNGTRIGGASFFSPDGTANGSVTMMGGGQLRVIDENVPPGVWTYDLEVEVFTANTQAIYSNIKLHAREIAGP